MQMRLWLGVYLTKSGRLPNLVTRGGVDAWFEYPLQLVVVSERNQGENRFLGYASVGAVGLFSILLR